MPSYLIETYLARSEAGEPAARDGRARSAIEAVTNQGTPVRFEHCIYIPEDELCFVVVDAPSGRAAAFVAQRAGLEPIRVVEAVSSRKEES